MDKRTVLVVDDDPSIRELIAELLDDAGFAVLEADSGGLALRLAREHCPSVVLMDQRLPDMSGLDVLKRLRTQEAAHHIRVMLVSGLAHQLIDGDHGADGVLAKPFDITTLLEQVEHFASAETDGVA
jgi:CheY-like chemotaxis protein